MSKNKELGLPYGLGMEKVLVVFDVDGTLVGEGDKLFMETISLMDFFAKQSWKNVNVAIWSGGGAKYAESMFRRLFPYTTFNVKFYSKLDHKELRKKYAKIIAIDDIQDTRLGDVNLIVRNK